MTDQYPREGQEVPAQGATPYVGRRNVEGGQDPKAPTPTDPNAPDNETDEERQRREEEERRRGTGAA